jgi:uncharacterized delta-60 repeat protein
LWLVLGPPARAQQAGSVDPSFGASLGLVGSVESVLTQPDGKVLVGGYFNRAIARLNADGTADTSFNPGTGVDTDGAGIIKSMALQPDGKIIVAGTFSSFAGKSRHNVARLLSDGHLDPSFDPPVNIGAVSVVLLQSNGKILVAGHGILRLNANGRLDTGFSRPVFDDEFLQTAALQTDGKVIIAGEFYKVDGVTRHGLARLNANGSLDSNFSNPTAIFFTAAILVQSDGKIILGGHLSNLDQTTDRPIARLFADGSIDASFNSFLGTNTGVSSLALQSDGKIVVGGLFTYDGGTHHNILRILADGALDRGFNPGTGTDQPIGSVSVQPDGKIVIGGGFAYFDGASRNSVARLMADGRLDQTFVPDVVLGPNAPVESVAVQPDGRIVIGGSFTSVNGVGRNGIARLMPDGQPDKSFDPGTGVTEDKDISEFGVVNTVTLQPNGQIIIAGNFSKVDGVSRNNLARLNYDGSLDLSFNPSGPNMGAFTSFTAIIPQSDGKIILAGNFEIVGAAYESIVRLNADGSLDNSFRSQTEIDAVVAAALQSDGKVVIAGQLNIATSDVSEVNAILARLDSNGRVDTSFPLGMGDSQLDEASNVAVQPDGELLITGKFKAFNGVARPGFVRVTDDGIVDPGFNAAINGDGVASISLQPDGKIIVLFEGAVVRLNTDGTLDDSFHIDTVNVSAIALQGDGSIFVGGEFTQIGLDVRNYLARLSSDGSVDPTFVAGGGVPNINTLVLQPADLKVVVGGNFAAVSGSPVNALARLNADGGRDSSFAPGFAAGDTVQALALEPDDGDVLVAALVGGDTNAAAKGNASPETRGLPDGPHAESKIHNVLRRCSKGNGQFDPHFSATTDGTALALIGLPGRLTFVGGSFDQIDNHASANLARLEPNGGFDPTFHGSADASVRALAPAADGRIIVVGDFANVDGAQRSHVARLVADGTLDASFDPGVGPNGSVDAVYALAGGQVLIAGTFTSVDGEVRGGVARLNANGSLDASFVPGPTTDAQRQSASPERRAVTLNSVVAPGSPVITSLDVQPDGKVVVGGLFNALGTTVRHNVARLNIDGSVDMTFSSGSGPDAIVNVLKLQPDGRTLLGGDFVGVEGLERPGAARLLGDKNASSN